jgi:hypothetical protein
MSYTLEGRKPIHQLEGGDVWIRNSDGVCVGTFIKVDPREPWRKATFRPRVSARKEFELTKKEINEVLEQLDAEQGMPIIM